MVSARKVAIISLIGALISSISLLHLFFGSSSSRKRGYLDDPIGYDSYVLATEWLASVCKSKSCLKEIPNIAAKPGAGPSNCNSIPLNYQDLQPEFQTELWNQWNSLYGNNVDFLDHEWSKHGTCWSPFLNESQYSAVPANILPYVNQGMEDYKVGTKGPTDYLNLTLALSAEYSIFDALKANDILPSRTELYPVTRISGAMERSFGVSNYTLLCTKDSQTGKSMLTEMRICLDLSYQPIDCVKKNTASCQASVEFPLI
jgi:ribonuclease I